MIVTVGPSSCSIEWVVVVEEEEDGWCDGDWICSHSFSPSVTPSGFSSILGLENVWIGVRLLSDWKELSEV